MERPQSIICKQCLIVELAIRLSRMMHEKKKLTSLPCLRTYLIMEDLRLKAVDHLLRL